MPGSGREYQLWPTDGGHFGDHDVLTGVEGRRNPQHQTFDPKSYANRITTRWPPRYAEGSPATGSNRCNTAIHKPTLDARNGLGVQC